MKLLAPRLAVVFGYLCATLVFTWPLPLLLSTHLTGDPGGDTGVYVWNQWVFHQELLEGHNPLSTQKILALTPRVDLSQHNYTPFLNVLALPLISPFGVIAAFNIVFLFVCVLNGLLTYGLTRRVTRAARPEAWLAGLVFAFAPVMVARSTGHYSLMAAAALPAFVWCLVNAERSRSVRDAALVGLCMAWAALSDAYFGIYCVIIAVLYLGSLVIRITRSERTAPRAWKWVLDVAIVCLAGLIAGMALGRGGEFTVLGMPVRMRTLYNPMLILTVLTLARVALWWRPHVERFDWTAAALAQGRRRSLLTLAAVAFLACVGPLSPVLYGLGGRIIEGRFASPQIFWRSSPRGVDLLSFITPNSQHPIVRWFAEDPLLLWPTIYVEYTASLSLVALAVIAIAMWRADYRPNRRWLVLTIAFALLALGPFIYVAGVNTHVPGPWALLRYLPGFGLARMPTRFAIIASLGIAVIFAGALAAIGTKWPQRRRLIVSAATLLVVFELWPAPRTLYSAAISPIYDRIAQDPRPVRVLSLPFGVRDGTWETGNFRPRSLFNQTRHGKALIGGYLSRISPRRVERMREQYPTLTALIKLSERTPLDPEVAQSLRERGDDLMSKGNVGYVVIDSRFIPPDRAELVIDSFKLRQLQQDGHLTLFVPDRPEP
ncbi:MAG TPA: hypothetical protein VEA16_12995 [Vicinamibacterales bacterium]|nr:hypothetical protein [Vicinamibacterales bacterium]